jgi:hypothetical protein
MYKQILMRKINLEKKKNGILVQKIMCRIKTNRLCIGNRTVGEYVALN